MNKGLMSGKRFRAAALSAIASVALAGCSGGQNSVNTPSESQTGTGGTASQSEGAKKNVTIKIYQSKVEINEALNKLKEEYEATHPGVTLEVDSALNDSYATTVKAKFAAGEMPDIFSVSGYRDFNLWADNLEDLSDQPWVKDMLDMAKPGITKDGKTYGLPIAVEGVGFLYNKDLFSKAGITEVPTTLTGLNDVVAKLKATGIPAFVTPYGSTYNPGVFGANIPFAKQADPNQFMNELNDGKAKLADNQMFKDWMNLTDLQIKNAESNPLTVDYNAQVSNFATQKGAMTPGCNCSQPLIDAVNPDLNLGVLPMPINDDPKLNDNIFVNVAGYWAISKNSPVKEEAKEFLNWLVTSDTGRKYITEQFKLIPAFKTFEAKPGDLGDLGDSVQEYVKAGKVLPVVTDRYPAESLPDEFGAAVQKYAAGKLTTHEEVLEAFQSSWDKLKNKK